MDEVDVKVVSMLHAMRLFLDDFIVLPCRYNGLFSNFQPNPTDIQPTHIGASVFFIRDRGYAAMSSPSSLNRMPGSLGPLDTCLYALCQHCRKFAGVSG
jgi:hypothetical protein